MIGLARAVLLVARYFRRIAISLEKIHDLYALDLESRGIRKATAHVKDVDELVYSNAPSDL